MWLKIFQKENLIFFFFHVLVIYNQFLFTQPAASPFAEQIHVNVNKEARKFL